MPITDVRHAGAHAAPMLLDVLLAIQIGCYVVAVMSWWDEW